MTYTKIYDAIKAIDVNDTKAAKNLLTAFLFEVEQAKGDGKKRPINLYDFAAQTHTDVCWRAFFMMPKIKQLWRVTAIF